MFLLQPMTLNNMKVLAIDPGYDRVGLAILEKVSTGETLHYSKCLETDRAKDLSGRILEVGSFVEDIILKYQPDTLAIETLFFNKNIKAGKATHRLCFSAALLSPIRMHHTNVFLLQKC